MHARLLAAAGVLLVATACHDTAAPPDAGLRQATRVASATTSLETFYGPERFTRQRGAPQAVERVISTQGYEAAFVLHVRNGDASGANRVSSATVSIDGAQLLAPSDFNQGAAAFELPVGVGATARLGVTLASAPGSYLEISLEGKRAATLFCPTSGDPSAYGDLDDAIAATEPEGTILVCDGDHTIDSVVINKPLTIRSEHSGMATLRDGNPNQPFQGGNRPALIVNNVPAGVVRIVDLHFVVGTTAIVAGQFGATPGTWDRVEIDSIHVTPRNAVSLTNATAIRPLASSVASAKMTVRNSSFTGIFIPVFGVGGNMDVFDSRFTDNGAAVIFSNNASRGVVEGNVITGCPSLGCIRLLGSGGVVVRNNTITPGPLATRRTAAIVVGTNVAHNGLQTIIENNHIIGLRNPAISPEQQAAYADDAGIAVNPSLFPNETVIRGNRIENVWSAITAGAPAGGSVEATDNVVVGGAYGITRNTSSPTTVTRNDFTGLARSIQGNNLQTGHYRCNWWGSTAGPTLPNLNIPASMYLPWAMQPVAGNASPCDPTPLQTILVCATPDASIFTVPAVQQAFGGVAAGGTVLFCDGTHNVANLIVNKSVTFAAKGPGMPTLDALNTFSSFNITTANTDVLVRGLRFRNASGHNVQINGGRSLRVESSEFHPRESSPYNVDRTVPIASNQGGIAAVATFTRLEAENNTFLGGDVGVHFSPNGPAVGVVRTNTFRGQVNSGVYSASAPTGFTLTVETNTFSECGRHGCGRVFTGGSDGGAFVTFSDNTFNVDISRPVWSVLIMNLRATGVGSARNNRFIGTGVGTGTRFDNSNYPIDGQAVQYGGHIALDGNVVTNAFAFATTVQPSILNASNNTITRIGQLLNSGGAIGAGSVIMRRNDATDVMQIMPFPQFFASYFLDCNWWGSASGPSASQVAPLPSSAWMPFATQPIANQPAVSCSP